MTVKPIEPPPFPATTFEDTVPIAPLLGRQMSLFGAEIAPAPADDANPWCAGPLRRHLRGYHEPSLMRWVYDIACRERSHMLDPGGRTVAIVKGDPYDRLPWRCSLFKCKTCRAPLQTDTQNRKLGVWFCRCMTRFEVPDRGTQFHSTAPPIPGPDDLTLFDVDKAALGRTIMLAIVRWVREHAPYAGALEEFRERHGMLAPTDCRPGREGIDSVGCRMHHASPDPNAAAFNTFLERGGPNDFVACAAYRSSFAWQVARSFEHLAEANADPKRVVAYDIDETGAIVPPDYFRPEDELLAELRDRAGAPILRSAIVRGVRRYMDVPDWYPKDAAKAAKAKKPRFVDHYDLGYGIDVYVEFLSQPKD